MSTALIAIVPGTVTGVAVFRDEKFALSYTLARDGGNARSQYAALQRILDQGRLNALQPEVVCVAYHGRVEGEGQVRAYICGWIEGLALTMGYTLHWRNPHWGHAYQADAVRLPVNTDVEMRAVSHALAWFQHLNDLTVAE